MASITTTPGAPDLLTPMPEAPLQHTRLTADAAGVSDPSQAPRWGIYLGSAPVLIADSVVSLSYKQESRVSDYPQELGAFQAYNKVATPYDSRVKMSCGGTVAARAAFLAKLESIVSPGDLNLYSIVTPEKTYLNANVHRYDYERTAAAGAGRVVAEIWLTEVRVSAAAAFSNTAAPSGSAQVNGGQAQAQAASSHVTNFVGRVPTIANTNFVGLVPNPAPSTHVGAVN